MIKNKLEFSISGFLSVLQAEHRTMAVFILAVIVNNYTTGQVRMLYECASLSVCFFRAQK